MKRLSQSVTRILSTLAAAVLLTFPVLAQSAQEKMATETDQGTEQKNVLIFFVDDLRPELGCYGVEAIKSPSIDALASEGVLFERAYCQQALCAPSRISMMTGQYPDNTGICDLFTPLRRANKTAITMPMHFQQNGYVTASFGKVHHHRTDDRENWTELPDYPVAKYADAKTNESIKQREAEARKEGLAGVALYSRTKGPATERADVDDDDYQDGVVAGQAIESLRRNQDKPFFMCVGFAKPHLPFAAPKRYWDLYQRGQFVVPNRQQPDDAPSLAFTNWGELRAYQDIPQQGDLSDELTRQLVHGYAASVSFADAQVGKVMAELDRLGLRDNTMVVLWGDHGYKLGDYGLWCKHTNLELDTFVPLIISAPGFARGERSKALVEVVDIFPTVAAFAGGKAPASCDGKSLEPLLNDPGQDFRPFAMSQYQRGSIMGYSLRNDRWRYTEWIQAGTQRVVARELYDHQDTKTPSESLASEPEHAELVSRLSLQLGAAQRIDTTKVKMKK